jgi:transcription-repair coupling factor (superfamily II helicase)
MRLKRLHPKSQYRPAAKMIQVPKPLEGGRLGGAALRDKELLDWLTTLLRDVVPAPAASVASTP